MQKETQESETVSTEEFKISPIVKVVVNEVFVKFIKDWRFAFSMEDALDDPEKPTVSRKEIRERILNLEVQEYVIEDEETGIGSWKSAVKREVRYPDGYGRGYVKNCIADIVLEYKGLSSNKI